MLCRFVTGLLSGPTGCARAGVELADLISPKSNRVNALLLAKPYLISEKRGKDAHPWRRTLFNEASDMSRN